MKQTSFAQAEYAGKRKVTRRDRFLAEMERLVPWDRLVTLVTPFYGTKKRGRPPIGAQRMLRVYFLQQWYGLADEALEDAIYDSQALRNFVGIDLGVESVPDATTLLKFRHLLEKHALTKQLLDEVNAFLEERGMLMREGTIVDATLIAAPPSTKNRKKARDPEMHQTKKGNQYYFGMKAHIGVDAHSGLVHTVTGTAANVSDICQTTELLHGDERAVFADAGYTGIEKREEAKGIPVRWFVARKRGKVKALAEGPDKARIEMEEFDKASIRAKVEHPFHVMKNLFRHRKVRYRGLSKNTSQLYSLFALANLYMVRNRMPLQG